MRILGIDPGIATIGFGVVDSDSRSHKLIKCGVITTPAHTSLSSRLEQIYDDMCGLLDMFKPAGASSCWHAGKPESGYMNTLRFRSSRRSSATAERRRARSWIW